MAVINFFGCGKHDNGSQYFCWYCYYNKSLCFDNQISGTQKIQSRI